MKPEGQQSNPPGRNVPTAAESFLGWLAAVPLRANVFLLFLSACAFLPGQTAIPTVDRDEARYAQASRQMMESGNYVDIHFQDRARYNQPAGIYWLQAAAAKFTGYGENAPIWVHRLPSLIAAIIAVLLVNWTAQPLASRKGSLFAALMMAATILLGVEARLAKTDAVLLCCTLTAVGFLARAFSGWRISLFGALVFWTACAAGLMVKGPLSLLLVGLTTATLCAATRSAGWLKRLRPGLGAAWLALLVLPWFVAIAFVSQGEFYRYALGWNLVGKLTGAHEGHGAPPGFYLLLFWVTFWPAAVLATTALPWVWEQRRTAPVQFCLAWIVPTWIVFELVPTKLPHYVLPVYPAIATLIAMSLLAEGRRPGRTAAFFAVLGAGIYVGALVAFPLLIENIVLPAAVGAGGAALALMAWGMTGARRASAAAVVAAVSLSAIVLNGTAAGIVAPALQTLWITPRLAASVRRQATCPNPLVASAGFHEPSLVFALGTGTRLVSGAEAARLLAAGECQVALVNGVEQPAFFSALAQLKKEPQLIDTVSGLNIGKVGAHEIGVYRTRAP